MLVQYVFVCLNKCIFYIVFNKFVVVEVKECFFDNVECCIMYLLVYVVVGCKFVEKFGNVLVYMVMQVFNVIICCVKFVFEVVGVFLCLIDDDILQDYVDEEFVEVNYFEVVVVVDLVKCFWEEMQNLCSLLKMFYDGYLKLWV